jgi:hypothetical protein
MEALFHPEGTQARGFSFVMAGLVPAIPSRKSTALSSFGITGTRPVMT